MIMTHSFWPLRLLTLLSPDFFGNPAQNNFWGYDNYWENAAYIGLIPLLLARVCDLESAPAQSHSRPDRFSGDDGDCVAHSGLWLVHADLSVLV